jgi:hypothetical protein
MGLLTSNEKTDYVVRETDDQGQVRHFRAATIEQAREQADRLLRCAAAWGRKYDIVVLAGFDGQPLFQV